MQYLTQLNNYVQNHYASIEGWCWEYNWQPIQYIVQRQADLGATGPIAEIGVYHGKFFIGLALLKSDTGPHLALDVFDMQQFSLSGSGSRIRVPKEASDQQMDKFRGNAERVGVDLSNVVVLRADSTALLAREVQGMVEGFQKFSLFSVDGCHEFTHAYNDISMAMELTDNYGVIFVDDYLHARWPGAQEAVAKHMFGGAPRFVPLYYVHNKLAMCHVNYHRDYLEGLAAFLKEKHPTTGMRRVTRYGWETLTIEPRAGEPVLAL